MPASARILCEGARPRHVAALAGAVGDATRQVQRCRLPRPALPPCQLRRACDEPRSKPAVLATSPGPAARSRAMSAAASSPHDMSSTHTQTAGLIAEEVRRSLFIDGFVVLKGSPSLASSLLEKGMVETGAGPPLEELVGRIGAVMSAGTKGQVPGGGCTDRVASPDPWWDERWEVDGLGTAGDWTATLAVSLTDTSQDLCGGLAVYPRSHWLVHDWLAAMWAGGSASWPPNEELPQPWSVPASAPVQLHLAEGDVALFHPLLAFTLAPNASATASNFHIFHVTTDEQTAVAQRTAQLRPKGGHHDWSVSAMWAGWTSLRDTVTRGLPRLESEFEAMVEDDEKAELGNWAVPSSSSSSALLAPPARGDDVQQRRSKEAEPLLPFPCSFVAPRDLVAFVVRQRAEALMRDARWLDAVGPLARLAGLRPKSFRPSFLAARCAIEGAPPGQLRGRAGRKCLLEDAERFLRRAIEIAPGWTPTYALLARNLVEMGRGREAEVPGVLESMLSIAHVDALCDRHVEAAQAVKEALEIGRRVEEALKANKGSAAPNLTSR